MFSVQLPTFVIFVAIYQQSIIMQFFKQLLLLMLSVALFSCAKQEGEGGTSTIKGKVQVKLCSDDFETIYTQFPGEEIDVYIVYGNDDFYSDKTTTFYDGSFVFNYLRKGHYQVFVYSDDDTGQAESGKKIVLKEIEITKNGKEYQLPTMEVWDQVTNYEGSSTIKGRVFAYDWNSDMTILKDSFYLRDEYVYLARLADDYYFERQRTFYNGSFEFGSLPMGTYQVYVYSRDASQQDPQDKIPIIKIAEITANRQAIDVGRIEIID